jgi:tetratricopeptide (TPR) repeat protein
MDVNSPVRIARVGGAVLALAVVCRAAAAADDAVYIEDSSSSMVVITSDSDDVPPLPPSAEPASELVVHVDDSPAPVATSAPAAPVAVAAARGDLTVVANQQRQEPLGAVIADSAVVPAGGMQPPNWNAYLGAGPHRPGFYAGTESLQRTTRFDRGAPSAAPPQMDAPPATRRSAVAQSPTSARPSPALTRAAAPLNATSRETAGGSQAVRPPQQSPTEQAKALLIRAYELSLSASNEAEYSQIAAWCAQSLRAGLDAESRQFSQRLSAWALNRRGQDRADEGQRELAQADFRAALELEPNNWRALHNKAVTLAQDGQFAEAFDDVTRVVELNPRFAKAFANRATLYVQAGDYERALGDYNSALELEPTLIPALVGRGRVHHLQGQLDEALASLDAAVRCDPDDAEIVCSRADLLADLGRYQDALQDYAQAIDLNPKFEHAYRNGAWLLATCPDDAVRDAEGALAGAQAALECGYGERHAALDTLAAAQANAGQFAEAAASVKQAIEIAPEDVRPAYESRLRLYEARVPFRTQPVGEAVSATVDLIESTTPTAQTAEYVEE